MMHSLFVEWIRPGSPVREIVFFAEEKSANSEIGTFFFPCTSN